MTPLPRDRLAAFHKHSPFCDVTHTHTQNTHTQTHTHTHIVNIAGSNNVPHQNIIVKVGFVSHLTNWSPSEKTNLLGLL